MLRNGSRYYVSHYAPDPVRAVELVREAGGVPVMAHPFAQRSRLDRRRLGHRGDGRGGAGRARGAPPRPRPAERAPARSELAARLGLFVTGSSDYHGAGKENRLGENTTAPEVLAQIEEQATSGIDVVRVLRVNDIINLQTFGSVFVTLLVIMDPPGALPIFLALTGSLTQKQKVGRRPAGLAGGARRDRPVRRRSGSRSSPTCTSRCRRCRAPAACCCCSSRCSC